MVKNNTEHENLESERMMIAMDHEFPDCLKDNVLYYISGFLVRSLLKQLECTICRSELLLDIDDPHARTRSAYPTQARFTCFKQESGVIFPSLAVLKIVKTNERNLDLEIQSSILEQIGIGVFNNHTIHFFDHRVGGEMDHLSSLLRKISSRYLNMRPKIFGKRYSEMVVHRNEPSLRNQLTKTILFQNQ